MSCAEVREWMHRYVDHDLSREEAAELFRHIDGCPDCAEEFTQLKLLSMELERLPEVRPPFSLVDAILPRLDEIDRAAAGEPSPVVPPAGLSGAKDAQNEMTRRSGDRSRRRGGMGMGGRFGIGAAAAALILGIAIFNMPKELPDAQVENSLLSVQDTGTKDAAAPSAAAASPDAEANSGQGAAVPEGEPDGAAATAAQAPDQANAASSANALGQEAAPSEAAPATGQTGGEDRDAAAAKQPADRKQPSAKAPATDASGSDVRKDLRQGTQQKKAAAPSSAPSSDPGAADHDSLQMSIMAEPEERSAGGGSAGIMGLAPAEAADSSWTSPDGLYTARLENGRLNFYSIPEQGSYREGQRLNSVALAGEWVSGGWSADGKTFVYTVRSGEEERTEQYRPAVRAEPEPTPAPSAGAEGTGASSAP
ncbi:hypothetical protein F4V43_04165 [Paenibacillus spiritus]|uniref:Anti-sigma-W factor RsiW n=1 Tax=Paenibacillus spiritus TaxID=2496557 RepID=A0A5J5GJJ8_9BACL|nr:anti-sigma factor [Paenibacillus spiritus]KAA9007684.1 hypothetical protein F4V43_04165 [Paenibacillus spiritus]